MSNLNEGYFDSCKAILESIVVEEDKTTRRLKYYDLIEKLDKLNGSVIKRETKSQRPSYDVIIFSVVPVEFMTLDKLLNVVKHPHQNAKYDLNGIWYYEFEIERQKGLSKLKALAALVGEAGDVNCSIACAKAFSKFNCDLAILCGIAAGVKDEAPLYSTVISKSIVNYEFQRLNKEDVTFRPRIHTIKTNFMNLLPKLDLQGKVWKDEFIKTYDVLIDSIEEKQEFTPAMLHASKLKTGVIASGAKLIADGKTLASLRDQIPVDKGIIAAEMEGSGFAPACEEYEVDWLVFRGISDHGEDDKNNPLNKKYQKMAAASAVTSMVFFLKYFYRTPRERSDLEF